MESDSNNTERYSNRTSSLYPCCSGEDIAVNGSFEEGVFLANGTVVDVNNAMTSSSFGGVSIDSLIMDRNTFWIEDPTRATDGNRFIYLPEAHDQGKCVIRTTDLFEGDLVSNATYQVTFDIAGFDENATESSTNYILEFFYRNADGSAEQEMVQDEFYLECTSSLAPNPIPTSNWNTLNWTRVTGEITLPPPNSSAYTEIRMIISANDGGGALLDNICVNKVAEAISITSEGTNPTSTINGSIEITTVSRGDRYEYNTTGFDDLPLTHAAATNLISGLPQTVVNNISEPINPTTYYLRVYDSDNSFKDTSIVFMPLSLSNYPESYACDNTTLLVGDLLPSGGGQTISFPFGTGNPAPPACSEKLNYGGEGLAYCENNNVVYIARFAPNQIGIWDLATNSLSDSILLTTGTPYDVAMTSDCSYLYIATSGGIERINLTTNTTDQTRSLADLGAVATGDGTPWGVDIHPNTGEVYITFGWGSWWPTFGGGPKESSILKVANDLQGTITEVVAHESNGLFMGMKFLPNGNFWVSWDGEEPATFPFPYVHSEEIRLYDDTGDLLDNKPIIIGGNQEYFTDPNDIAFGPDGNIYVTTYAVYCVVRYLPATDTWEEYLGPDPAGATGKNLEFVCANVFCVETLCGDGIDNDGDGLIDCYDPDCTPNLIVNGGFEDTGAATFSTTFEGSPAEALPRSTNLIPGWNMDYSCIPPCPDGYLIDDSANNINNPEGDHFIWLAGSGYCARQTFDVEVDACYEISMDVASWASPGPQTGTETTFSVEAFSGGIDNGSGGTLELYRTQISASPSWANLNWQTLSFTWTGPITTNTNLFFSQKGGPSSNGLAIDNIRIQKTCCLNEICDDGIDNDGDGLIDEYCVDDCDYKFDKNNVLENGEGNWSFDNTEVILGDSYQYDSLGSTTFSGLPIGGGLFNWGQTGNQTLKLFHDPTNNSGHPEGEYFTGIYDGTICLIDSTGAFGKCGFELCLHSATTVDTWIIVESTPNLTNANDRKQLAREYRNGSTLWNWEETCIYIHPDSIPPLSDAIIVSISPTGGSPYPPVYIDDIRINPVLGLDCYVEICEEEICDDGIDNDGDGLIDCYDSDCPSCTPQDCTNEVQVMAVREENAIGTGVSGIPSISNFFIPEGNNRAILIAAFFEREHCQSGDDCTTSNTSSTGLGDNFASATALSSRQITARFTGAGGSIDRLNPLFLPDGDLRFGNQNVGITSNSSTSFYSREAYYIAIYESEIQTLLSGAPSGNISVILPDVLTPLDEADEAIILGYVFANVGQTASGIVRSGSDISNDPTTNYAGNYTLSDTDLDYLQEPNEPEDGILVLGMNGVEGYGFENISGFTTITNTSVSNNLGDYQMDNEADGFSLTGQFRNGPASGIFDNISMQSAAPSSLNINGGFMSVFTIESCGGIEICGNGIDDDSDGYTDFEDSDCDLCSTNFTSEKFYISKYGSSSCGDDVLVLDWNATSTAATNEQNLGQDVGGAGWSDIAFTPDGRFYGNWTSDDDNMELYSLDPLSGRYINYICQIDGANPYITQWELVSDIDGYLYTILGDGTTTALYKYKPTDINADNICDSLTLVLDLTASGLVGDGDLAWSNGLLYWSATASNSGASPAQLVEINIQLGTYIIHPLVDDLGNNLSNVDAVVNDSEGNLIIGDENSILYEVDKTDFSVSVAYNLTNNCGGIGGLSTRYEFLQSESCPEICDNGIDDDNDGLIDCADCDDCATSTLCNDNDNDGIGDFCDLDDDNDGIPDTEERCRQNDQVYYDRAFPSENINGNLDVGFSGQLGLTGRIVTSFGSGGSATNPIYEDATTGLGITSIGGGVATTGAQTSITFNTTVTMEQFIVTSVAKDYSGSYDESQEIRFYANGTQVEFIPVIVGTNGNPNVYATYNTATGVALGEDPTVAGTGGEAGFHFVIDRGVDSIVVMQHTGATFDNVGIRFFLICSDRDIDNDGVPDYFDLDSDNDGIFDLDEAGHTAADTDDDGIIDGPNSDFGTNGFFDFLETAPDDGIINYTLAVSDGATDGTYDAVKLDADGDGCFDAEEAGVPDFENDGIAGTGTPTVDGNGLVTTIIYVTPPNNNWQDPSLGICFLEICDDGIDNDLDGLIDSLDPDCISCCDGNNIAINGSFESGSFSSNASVVDPNNAMVSASFGGLPIDDFDTDSGVFWIDDATRATDGNRFIYLPDAATSGKCVYQTESLFGGDLTACATYEVTFDIAGFDDSGTAANTNYILEFFYKNADGSVEQEMVQENFIIECTSDPAPNPIATSDWNNLNWTRVTGTISLPPPNDPALNRIELLISVNNGGGALLDNVCVNKIAENISITTQSTDPTCVDDGVIQILSVSSGDRYEYNTTGFDDLPLTYATAANTISTLPQTVVNNIPPSNPTTTYYIRVYESGNCFKDTSIVINGSVVCPEICNDGIDNDFDGLTDCDDPGCITTPVINLSATTVCVNEIVLISSSNSGSGTTYSWSFGTDANPTTATGIGGHNISYTSCGTKTITLTVERNGCTITVDTLITVEDLIAPVWTIDPIDLIMECDPSANYPDSINFWLSSYGNGVTTDNCNSVSIFNDYISLTPDCGNTASTSVNFTAIDSCGNSTLKTAQIQILDTTAPTIPNIPDVTVECDIVPIPSSPIITDVCDPVVDVVFQEVMIQHPSQVWGSSTGCSLLHTVSEAILDDKGTVSITDDEMTFTLTVIGKNTGSTWTANVNGTAISGDYYKTYQFGPVLSNGSNLNFLIMDDLDNSCTQSVVIDIADF